MEKNVLGKGQYVTTGTMFIRGEFKPEETKIALTEQGKAAILECLTESDEFHKLVCDITGVERKQEKVSPELEKLKEDYSHMCESYEHEKQQRNDLIRKWREETAKRLDAERERDCAQRHHKFVMDELSQMLKEVECNSVRGIIDELKAERANGKLLAEDNELCRRESDKLKESYNKLCEEFIYAKSTKNNLLKEYDKLKEDYDGIAESHEHLNKRNQNQAKTITDQMKEVVHLREELNLKSELTQKNKEKSEKLQCKLDEVTKQNSKLIEEMERLKKCYQIQTELVVEYDKRCQKLQSKLDKASERYGELIKTISDRAIKSV